MAASADTFLEPASRPRVHQGTYDIAVIGGGLVGSAVAFGLRQHLHKIAVLDEGDLSFRASRGNFGLIWVQGKGMGMPAYGQWTLTSRNLWRTFADTLEAISGCPTGLELQGGLHPLLSEAEYTHRISFMQRLMAQPGMADYRWELLDHQALRSLVPQIGPEVLGAIHTHVDGVANPLKLLRALHTAFQIQQVDYLPHHAVSKITPTDHGFVIQTPQAQITAERVVLTAGLGNRALGEPLGLHIPVRPQRGQVIVMERTQRVLHTPFTTLRQMDEGSWLIGDSQEEVGFTDRVTELPVLATMADRAVRTLPMLRDVRVVRSWSALRVMSEDGFPVYDESPLYPGAFVATCHSGVTLAAAHALELAPCLARGTLPERFTPFSLRRFHAQPTA